MPLFPTDFKYKSDLEMMRGAFWTMCAFMFAELIFKVFIYITVYQELITR